MITKVGPSQNNAVVITRIFEKRLVSKQKTLNTQSFNLILDAPWTISNLIPDRYYRFSTANFGEFRLTVESDGQIVGDRIINNSTSFIVCADHTQQFTITASDSGISSNAIVVTLLDMFSDNTTQCGVVNSYYGADVSSTQGRIAVINGLNSVELNISDFQNPATLKISVYISKSSPDFVPYLVTMNSFNDQLNLSDDAAFEYGGIDSESVYYHSGGALRIIVYGVGGETFVQLITIEELNVVPGCLLDTALGLGFTLSVNGVPRIPINIYHIGYSYDVYDKTSLDYLGIKYCRLDYQGSGNQESDGTCLTWKTGSGFNVVQTGTAISSSQANDTSVVDVHNKSFITPKYGGGGDGTNVDGTRGGYLTIASNISSVDYTSDVINGFQNIFRYEGSGNLENTFTKNLTIHLLASKANNGYVDLRQFPDYYQNLCGCNEASYLEIQLRNDSIPLTKSIIIDFNDIYDGTATSPQTSSDYQDPVVIDTAKWLRIGIKAEDVCGDPGGGSGGSEGSGSTGSTSGPITQFGVSGNVLVSPIVVEGLIRSYHQCTASVELVAISVGVVGKQSIYDLIISNATGGTFYLNLYNQPHIVINHDDTATIIKSKIDTLVGVDNSMVVGSGGVFRISISKSISVDPVTISNITLTCDQAIAELRDGPHVIDVSKKTAYVEQPPITPITCSECSDKYVYVIQHDVVRSNEYSTINKILYSFGARDWVAYQTAPKIDVISTDTILKNNGQYIIAHASLSIIDVISAMKSSKYNYFDR